MGGLVNCPLPSGLSPGSEGKWQGTSQLASSLNLPSRRWHSCAVNTTLSFCCNRKLVPYEIATVVMNNNRILIDYKKLHEKSILWNFSFVTLQVTR
jgi:hypothetical protein